MGNELERKLERIMASLFLDKKASAFGKCLLGFDIKIGEFPFDAMAAINIRDGQLLINTKNTKEDISLEHLTFIILHELGHPMFLSTERIGTRDHQLWNIAEDYMINEFINELVPVFEKSGKIKIDIDIAKKNYLFDNELRNKTSEEIYNIIKKENYSKEEKTMSLEDFLNNNGEDSKDESSNGKSSKDGGQVKITDITFERNGAKIKKQIVEFPGIKKGEKGKKVSESVKKAIQAARQSLKDIGNESSSCSKIINYILDIKIPWDLILRDCLEDYICEQNEVSWGRTRISSFLMDYNLPGFEDEEIYNTVVFVNDESGSISPKDNERFHNILFQAKQYFKELVVIKHDTELVWEKSFESENLGKKEEAEIMVRRAFGGTSHKPVFKRIQELQREKENISCIICCTDLYSDIESCQHMINNIPTIYIGGNDMKKSSDSIKGIKIETN